MASKKQPKQPSQQDKDKTRILGRLWDMKTEATRILSTPPGEYSLDARACTQHVLMRCEQAINNISAHGLRPEEMPFQEPVELAYIQRYFSSPTMKANEDEGSTDH